MDIAPETPFVWRSAFHSHTGSVRTVNEDACLDAPDIGLWAVADGMGGHEGGQIASRLVIDALDCVPDRSNAEAFAHDIEHRLEDVNRRLRSLSQTRFGGRTIGSTVAVLLAHVRKALCLWVGDSRLYLFREGRLRQVSRDHSAVEDLIDQGVLDREAARHHRLRNVITRAVGAHDALMLDTREEEIRHGDVLLLCTDGLNKVVEDEEIAHALANGMESNMENDVAALLVQLALRRKVSDNVTVGVVQALEASRL